MLNAPVEVLLFDSYPFAFETTRKNSLFTPMMSRAVKNFAGALFSIRLARFTNADSFTRISRGSGLSKMAGSEVLSSTAIPAG